MKSVSTFYANALQQLEQRLPKAALGLVPAHAFFVRSVTLPKELNREETDAFIELYLESKAPFPIEHLLWGYVEDPQSHEAIAYATTKGRLRQLGMDAPDSYLQLFPGFIGAFAFRFDQPTVRFFLQSGSLTAAIYGAPNYGPQKLISLPVTDTSQGDGALLELRARMAARLNLSEAHVESTIWANTAVEQDHRDNLQFQYRIIGSESAGNPAPQSLDFSTDQLWAADLRDREFSLRERTKRRKSLLLWRSLRAAGWAAIILLLLQIGNFGVATAIRFQESRISDLGSKAIRIENKFTLANRLTESTDQDIRPFALLEAINPLRPSTVYFNKIRTRNYNSLEVEGDSEQGVNPVNDFADAILRLPFVASVDSNVQTRSNQTSFSFRIKFSALPPDADIPFHVPRDDANATANIGGQP